MDITEQDYGQQTPTEEGQTFRTRHTEEQQAQRSVDGGREAGNLPVGRPPQNFGGGTSGEDREGAVPAQRDFAIGGILRQLIAQLEDQLHEAQASVVWYVRKDQEIRDRYEQQLADNEECREFYLKQERRITERLQELQTLLTGMTELSSLESQAEEPTE